ncbi:methyltransferase [Methylobacterium aquaticum]|uniref:methyltransferase n=1 Tax=Methylobacterium aquaticum TaxID=270351 RepID=UPI003D16ED00
MRVSPEILAILDRCACDGNALSLAGVGQLDRMTYSDVNKVLVAAGGKWNRKAQAHLFDGDAAEAIEPILLTGEVTSRKVELQQFDTPELLARQVVARAGITDGMSVLEPSAGLGALARAARDCHGAVTCVEIDERRFDALRQVAGGGLGTLVRGDFLSAVPLRPLREFDRVVMNPPFTRDQDIAHVRHAAQFLKPGGRLAAIMSGGVTFRTRGAAPAFREWVASLGGTIERLPDNAFAESGTNVSTVLVVVDMPGGAS